MGSVTVSNASWNLGSGSGSGFKAVQEESNEQILSHIFYKKEIFT